MVGTILNDVFERVYLTIKLSLMFWGMTLSGLVVFGIGPAISVVNALFAQHEFKWQEITWLSMWSKYKEEFVIGNKIFWTYSLIALVLAYNLYLAIQIKHFVFFVISFVLIILIVFLMIMMIFAFINHTFFELKLSLLHKLSFGSIFSNFFLNIKIVIIAGLLIALALQFKGLILFVIPGLAIIIYQKSLKGWIKHVESQLD